MRSTRTSLYWSRLARTLLLGILLLSAAPTHAAGHGSPQQRASTAGIAQHNGVLSLADGSLRLADDAPPAPLLLGAYSRSGFLIAEALTFNLGISRAEIRYDAETPPGTAVRVDLRGSADGRRWQEWVVGLPAGAVVGFGGPVRYVQYRLTLMGGLGDSPVVRGLAIEPSKAPARYEAAAPSPFAVAPTFRIRATRQGMVGGRTANGYIIPPRARFVSLPCWCALSSKGGDEYKVRITYRGRSTVVPVYDVGPYSPRDDYWSTSRSGFPDLERGWPMDHAAYYEGYNGRQADKGYVRFPTAIDVGDGVWWDELGINGDQAEVEVTYLWLGQDPHAGPPARDPAAPEHVVDELGGDFWQSAAALNASAVGCGMGRHAYWTTSTTDPNAGAPVARWQPNLPTEALYDLYVHVPACPAKRQPVAQARYVVQHRDGAVELAVSQQRPGWVLVGRFPFRAGADGFLQLGGLAGDSGTVWFDQARWVRVP